MNTNILKPSLYAGVLFTLVACQSTDLPTTEWPAAFKGITNQPEQADKPYLTAGDKTYIIGQQNGDFPDMGGHAPGEMGGIWNQRIKLLDGFWVKIVDENGNAKWLDKATSYTTYPEGSSFKYENIQEGLTIDRFQFCPNGKNGAVITYTLTNNKSQPRQLTLEFVAKTDLYPVWPGEELGVKNEMDSLSWDTEHSLFQARDKGQNWFAVWGSTQPIVKYQIHSETLRPTQGKGISGSISQDIEIKANASQTVTFVVSGSTQSMDDALSTYQEISSSHDQLLEQKRNHYAQLLKRGNISIPDPDLQEVYNWCKINTEWLVQDLDSVGLFLGAGAIEYPWLFGCDNSYSLQGVVASGNQTLAMQTLRILKEMSEQVNGNGRILHEMSFSQDVWNKGNTQETAHFIVAVWQVFQWTGDKPFLQAMYPYMQKGIQYLFDEMDTNSNGYPEGYGIMEVRGLNAELIDVAVYSQQALDAMSHIATLMGDDALSAQYAERANYLLNKINQDFWDEQEGLYTDFYGTREQALKTTKGAIEQVRIQADDKVRDAQIAKYEAMYKQFEQYPKGTQKGWLTNRNWVISTPIETQIAPQKRAISQLEKIRKEHCGPYGPYLSAVEGDRMMTIATGVQAMAEAAYGRIDESMAYVHDIVKTFGRTLPGSINEMMPDYGCPAQAWTIYGIVTPLISYVFGIQPQSYKQTIKFAPQLPTGWDQITITDLEIAHNVIDYQVVRTDRGLDIKLTTTQPDWTYQVEPKNEPIHQFIVNGKTQPIP